MITIIAGTNRKGSKTSAVAEVYKNILEKKGVEFNFCNLAEELPKNFVSNTMYGNPTPEFQAFQEKFLIPTTKFIIIIPEYNGSIPGIFKLMIDASDIGRGWNNKKASITGVAAGRAGNLRGLDHLTNMLNYLKVNVFYNKIPFSGIGALVGENGVFNHLLSIELIESQIEGFLHF